MVVFILFCVRRPVSSVCFALYWMTWGYSMFSFAKLGVRRLLRTGMTGPPSSLSTVCTPLSVNIVISICPFPCIQYVLQHYNLLHLCFQRHLQCLTHIWCSVNAFCMERCWAYWAEVFKKNSCEKIEEYSHPKK